MAVQVDRAGQGSLVAGIGDWGLGIGDSGFGRQELQRAVLMHVAALRCRSSVRFAWVACLLGSLAMPWRTRPLLHT
ncbi:hypothetical protein XarbCFBP7408_15325 [Xanthomonas arboricola pv. guizotiae]|nr:hypothetical protein XarbCFBP7408_15325 [Xanthomonas arboricola pv. guizotiae]